MSEVVRLAGELSNRVLDAQIMKRPIREDEVRALIDAAGLLEEHAVPWPPLMLQVLRRIHDEAGAGASGEAEPAADSGPQETPTAKGLFRFLSPLRVRRA
ncbi:hypothetical protein DK389_24400 [Methylobacterium durans]|uniref:Uncharacterized protein n=2 Tax=Methylobacterium durans TaxID=2202825 RepID=A0A2U8WHN1_9HYPH|nr:hypothetical protein DK389_24400 [Methylobacterium durans]